MRSTSVLAARIDRRASGHAAACRALLGSADGIDHRAAALRHLRFVGEVLAELAGKRHPCFLGPSGDPADPADVAEADPAQALPRGDLGPCPGSEDRTTGRGTLYVSVHRGNWIVGARILGDRGDPLHTVAGTQLHPRLSPWLVRWLGARGVVVHPPRSSWRHFRRTLLGGGRVFLHLDGDPYPQVGAGLRVRTVPPGVRSAAHLAARCAPRVISVLCLRTSAGSFEIRRTPLDPGGGVPAASRTPSPSELWERLLLAHLRGVVQEAPEDWILFRGCHLGREI